MRFFKTSAEILPKGCQLDDFLLLRRHPPSYRNGETSKTAPAIPPSSAGTPGAGEFIRPPWRCWAWRGRTVKTSPVTLNKASEKTWGMQRYSNEHNLTSQVHRPICCVLISPDIKPIWICWCSSKENIQHKQIYHIMPTMGTDILKTKKAPASFPSKQNPKVLSLWGTSCQRRNL